MGSALIHLVKQTSYPYRYPPIAITIIYKLLQGQLPYPACFHFKDDALVSSGASTNPPSPTLPPSVTTSSSPPETRVESEAAPVLVEQPTEPRQPPITEVQSSVEGGEEEKEEEEINDDVEHDEEGKGGGELHPPDSGSASNNMTWIEIDGIQLEKSLDDGLVRLTRYVNRYSRRGHFHKWKKMELPKLTAVSNLDKQKIESRQHGRPNGTFAPESVVRAYVDYVHRQYPEKFNLLTSEADEVAIDSATLDPEIRVSDLPSALPTPAKQNRSRSQRLSNSAPTTTTSSTPAPPSQEMEVIHPPQNQAEDAMVDHPSSVKPSLKRPSCSHAFRSPSPSPRPLLSPESKESKVKLKRQRALQHLAFILAHENDEEIIQSKTSHLLEKISALKSEIENRMTSKFLFELF